MWSRVFSIPCEMKGRREEREKAAEEGEEVEESGEDEGRREECDSRREWTLRHSSWGKTGPQSESR